MTAIFVPISTQAAIDAAVGAGATEAVTAAGVAAAPVVAVLAAGAAVDYTLLNNPTWNHFWEGVGANVTNWYQDAVGFLFGSAGVTFTTVHAMVQLALHGANRLSRELFTEASVAAHAGIHVLAKYMDAVRGDIRRITSGITHLAGVVAADLVKAEGYTQGYVEKQLRKLLDDVRGIDVRLAGDIESWVRRDIANPILGEIAKVEGKLGNVIDGLEHAIDTRVSALTGAKFAALAATIAGLAASVATVATEIEECAQPMCETMGPKTDFGKLLAQLSKFKWLAVLAALEATDIKDLEHLASAVAGTEADIGTWVATHILGELEAEHG